MRAVGAWVVVFRKAVLDEGKVEGGEEVVRLFSHLTH